MNKPNLAVEFAGIKMKNPVMTASGTCGYGRELSRIFPLERLGAISVKGTTLEPRFGNNTPRIAETPAGLLNCVGLQNPGAKKVTETELPWVLQHDLAVIVNIAGGAVEDYGKVAAMVSKIAGVAALEVNISCPNVSAGGMAHGAKPETAAAVVKEVRKNSNLPMIVKLSPNVTSIAEIAKAVEEAGADAVSLINTLLGMEIDITTKSPLLGNKVGGLSGPAVRPVAVRMVWQVAQAVNIPIIGMGGIMTAEDALQFMMAGASAVAIGSGTMVDPMTPLKVIEGLAAWLLKENIADINDIVGAAVPSKL